MLRGNFEDVAMQALARDDAADAPAGARGLEALFTGQPGTPGRGPAGAIQLGACEAEVLLLGPAGCRIEDLRRCPAGAGRPATAGIVNLVAHPGRQLVEGTAERTAAEVRRFQLMIADENHSAVMTRECGHAVMRLGHEQPIAHPLARTRHDRVGVSVRQVEQAAGVGSQRADLRVGGAGRWRERGGHGGTGHPSIVGRRTGESGNPEWTDAGRSATGL